MTTLTYGELMLGEKARNMFLKDANADIAGLPTYLNTRTVVANLNVTDMAIAAVLGGLNLLLVGDTGCGKTQLAKDIYNYYFGGNKKENGNGVFMRGRPDLDVYNEIFTELNIERATRVLTDSIESVIYLVDELNRCPPVGQNQFFGLGDGTMDYNGRAIKIGKEGYHILVATANIGNGEFSGTFNTDKALYNRAHIAIDFDFAMYKPTLEDNVLLDAMFTANPNVKDSRKRDLTDRIIQASREIADIAKDPGRDILAVKNYLQFGLDNCMAAGCKEKKWPQSCQDCDKNKGKKKGSNGKEEDTYGICSLVRAPVRRTINATIKYAASLYYLAKLKDPNVSIDGAELMFKAFEMTGAYQQILNPTILQMDYAGENPRMMSEVAGMLRRDFEENRFFINAKMEAELDKGKAITGFFRYKQNGVGKIGLYDDLDAPARKKTIKIEPFTDDRAVGMKWVEGFVEQMKRLKR
ncbi:MAG: AAA family ATPase [Candidatus Nanoarchaeia archaeon]|jgi:MoxR-like ATPase